MRYLPIIYFIISANILFGQIKTPKNRILVVGGGGARGAWGAGMVKGLINQNKESYKLIVGTSTGALMSPLIALNKFDTLKYAYTNIKTRDIFKLNPFINNPNKQKLRIINTIFRLCKPSLGVTDGAFRNTVKKFI